jgi:glycosyltransferase involved in cell wall biosynthesis
LLEPERFGCAGVTTTLWPVPSVLHVLPHRGGGGEYYIDLLGGLAEYEHQRVAFSSSRSLLPAMPAIVRNWPGVARRANAADLLHVHGDVAAALSWPLLRRNRGVVTSHGLHLLRRLEGPARRPFVGALRAALEGARVTICTSEVEREELTALLPAAAAERLVTIDNGVPTPPAPDAARRAATRAALGVEESEALFLFLGQLEPRKAPLAAVAAAQTARAHNLPVVLAVAGEGPLYDRVVAAAGPAVRALGFRSDVQPLLEAADVFVLPSAREGLSFALLEAMAWGLPVVVCDGPGNP